ncbi:hypothetical protein [Paenibacillus fonticola]|uniref:hypothetical protein n=1 Tax=Paenibacillus fonticola TaxID=379896 RepID=UPI0003A88404|nr:hypothetical protein [Paenibacillus fonticola]
MAAADTAADGPEAKIDMEVDVGVVDPAVDVDDVDTDGVVGVGAVNTVDTDGGVVEVVDGVVSKADMKVEVKVVSASESAPL